jgi:hypothetical protein
MTRTTCKEANTPVNIQANLIAQPNRHLLLGRLYIECYPELLSTALGNPQITAVDANGIVAGLTSHLDAYFGPASGSEAHAAFVDWASAEIRYARDFTPLYHDCEDLVYSAVWSVLGSCSRLGCDEDTVNEVAGEVWLWAWENRVSLLGPNEPANPSTRLYAKARWLALAERQHRLRERKRFTATMDEVSRTGIDENGKTFVEPHRYNEMERVGKG